MRSTKLKIAIALVSIIIAVTPLSSQKLFKNIIEVELGTPLLSIKKYNLRDQFNSGLQGGFWGAKFSIRVNRGDEKYYEIGYDNYLQRTNFNPFEKDEYFFVYETEKISTIQLKKGIKKRRFNFEYGVHYSRQVFKRSGGFIPSLPDPINEDLGVSFDIQYHLLPFLSLDWTNRFNLLNLNGGNAGGFSSGVTSLGASVIIK